MSDGEVSATGSEGAKVRVGVAYFPVYSEVRHVLPVWQGRLRKQVTGLQSTPSGTERHAPEAGRLDRSGHVDA